VAFFNTDSSAGLFPVARSILVCFLISGALVLVDIAFADKDCGF
jgi:hypothetical protein